MEKGRGQREDNVSHQEGSGKRGEKACLGDLPLRWRGRTPCERGRRRPDGEEAGKSEVTIS